ncbi:hypothetical protein [Acholeplasma laidlawii]|jgi:hypothetical protein|uniref:Uncharacterized protein n=2 Tax=Acholeplasma laidlawii TaxID=2148 RepID=A9NEZ3_ACHLI|nr:hypothetical protein [Acholeplasma laidlawii]ABX80923.1 hypothetical protein ACL_0301 [Acholeplasma laidlawii PG-8A]NWH10513.1 hypothetical protein [Acholeplasma laidlawii]NWH11901.1 hypothetical protein [Acholeplasma laidlawii]NWH12691.1 hypothetical protein [Acholeplasma laidlawii]NWH13929.1 hypothetical protein [Acholeplasma laidlawii]
MERLKYGIKNSRIWHLCSQDIEVNKSMTLDNWTRYRAEYREIYYLNDTIKFLEVDHFNHVFKFFDANIRKHNIEDFRRYFKDFQKYKEVFK